MKQDNALVFWDSKGNAVLTIQSDVLWSSELDKFFTDKVSEILFDRVEINNTSEEYAEVTFVDYNGE